jgi:hypothetical protein
MQTCVGAVKLKAAETHRDIFVGLEAPEQQARIADVLGRESCFDQRGFEPVALPRGQRQGEQAAPHDGDSFAPADGRQ